MAQKEAIESAVLPAGLYGFADRKEVTKVVRNTDNSWDFEVTVKRLYCTMARGMRKNGWEIDGVKLEDGEIVLEIFRSKDR